MSLKSDPIETATTWDHETGDIWITTNHRPTKTRLKKLGLKPDEDHDGMQTFRVSDSEIKVRISPYKPKKLDKRAREMALEGLSKARAAKEAERL